MVAAFDVERRVLDSNAQLFSGGVDHIDPNVESEAPVATSLLNGTNERPSRLNMATTRPSPIGG
jgi:hypothetical protein